VSACICRELLAEMSRLADDSREETRLRRTYFGVEIQRWRLASMIVIPDDSMGGASACVSDVPPGAVPLSATDNDTTAEDLTRRPSPREQLSHERS
jgi:hypothetical protein